MEEYIEKIKLLLIEHTPSILTAFAILIIGLFVISLLVKTARKIMLKRSVDVTLQKFLGNLLGWILKIVLFITVIAKLGIATTFFVAILGAAGLAVGLALQGSLANFAGGFNNDI